MKMNSTKAGGAATGNGAPITMAVEEESASTKGVFSYVDPLPPTFPLDALPTVIQQLATEGATAIGCPPEFVAGPALVVAASAIGMSRAVEITSSHREPPILFLAVVGVPGAAKSPAEGEVLIPVHRRHETLRTGGDNPGAMQPLRDLYTTSPTVEGLAKLLADNPRGILVCPDEITGFVRALNQYKKGHGNDRQQWLSFWSARSIKLDRKTAASIHVLNPCVNLVGGLNPDLLRELRGDDGAQDGFLERFLLVYPECPRHAYRRVPITDATREAWAAVVNRLYDLTPEKASPYTPRVVTFSTEAGQHYEWAINQLRERTWDGPLHSMGRKFETYLARLALVLHYLRWAEHAGHDDAATIEDADVQTAIMLLGYFIAQAGRVLRQLPVTLDDKQAGTVLRWARKQGHGDLKVRDLQRSDCLGRQGFNGVDQYRAVLRQLVDRGLVAMVDVDKGTTFRLS